MPPVMHVPRNRKGSDPIEVFIKGAVRAFKDYFKSEEDVDTFRDRGFPAYMTKANPDTWARTSMQGDLGSFDPKTLPKSLPRLETYRADPTGRYGGKEGLETRPTIFSIVKNSPDAQGSPSEIYASARSLARAKKYGVPQLDATQLAAMALKEGKANFGALAVDENNAQYMNLYIKLMNEENLPESGARFAVLVKAKMDTAKRLGITFEEAWNGTGRSDWSGKTGKDYARDFPHHLKAARHSKNKKLVDLIQSALDAEKK